MVDCVNLRRTTIALNSGTGAIPALGFGTRIPDPIATRTATKAALEAGFRLLDAAERYRNEKEVGEAIQRVFKAGNIKREEVFIATKLWNNNHRPERVKPAFEASLKKLQLDYADLYLIRTPFAFQPGHEQDPRDESGNVVYDKGVTLLDTWRALEALADEGNCKAIGLSDVSLEQTKQIFETARIKPAVVHVESHPYRPQWELLDYCRKNGIVLQAFAALGHSSEPNLLEDPVIAAIAKRVNKTAAQVLLARGHPARDGSPDHLEKPGRIKEDFEVSSLPEGAVQEISEGAKLRVRFNAVVETGVPGFIPRMFDLDHVIRERHSTRLCLPRPVRRALVEEALVLAQRAPSNSDIQPWNMVFAAGPARDRLVGALAAGRLAIRTRTSPPTSCTSAATPSERTRCSSTTDHGGERVQKVRPLPPCFAISAL
jgi:diketogulonate reductase-like aldo/keto reductase